MIDEKRKQLSELYFQFGVEARKIVMVEYEGDGISLSRIRTDEVKAASMWQNRKVNWNWEQLLRNSRNYPRRIDLGIWCGDELCGLALGKVTKGRMYARIDRVEGAPDRRALLGLVGEIALRYLEVVGGIAGCSEAVIVAPASGLIEFYGNLGYVDRVDIGGKMWGLKRSLTPLAMDKDPEEFTS